MRDNVSSATAALDNSPGTRHQMRISHISYSGCQRARVVWLRLILFSMTGHFILAILSSHMGRCGLTVSREYSTPTVSGISILAPVARAFLAPWMGGWQAVQARRGLTPDPAMSPTPVPPPNQPKVRKDKMRHKSFAPFGVQNRDTRVVTVTHKESLQIPLCCPGIGEWERVIPS